MVEASLPRSVPVPTSVMCSCGKTVRQPHPACLTRASAGPGAQGREGTVCPVCGKKVGAWHKSGIHPVCAKKGEAAGREAARVLSAPDRPIGVGLTQTERDAILRRINREPRPR